jgi:alkylhydroperoxidase family enzyme
MFGLTSLVLLLPIMVVLVSAASVAAAPEEVRTQFPLLSDEECWRKLPPAEKGGGQPLPSWARALAGTMPRTTAAFIRLDQLHRSGGPLDPKLRATMRWVAAHANSCAYSEAYAAFDAFEAGVPFSELEALRRGDYSWADTAQKLALEFAKKMTVDSAGVTDAEFAELVKHFDERKVAAMVLLTAYSNFQDRLLLCLGSSVEPGGPMPPLDVVFVPEAVESKMARPMPSPVSPLPKPTGKDLVEDDPDWISLEDTDTLKHDFDTERALFILTYASRCNYMTRISNGFQLSLERDNVFFEYYADDEKVEPSQRDSKR